VSALIVVILAVFLVTKFNSHESARVSTSSSPAKTVKKSSSSSSKSTKNDKKNSNPHVKNEDTKDETVEVSESSVAKDSATKDTDETVLSSGGVSEPTKEKTGEETQSSSSFNGKQLSSGDYSSIAGTWTNSRGEFVTISPDGTVQNGSGYTYHLYSGHLNNGNFSGTIASDIDSAAFWAIPGSGNGHLDHLVIGQSDDAENYPFYRN
ncbi:MAG: DUF6287 domain-containing protein, partial [Streptococcus salivarius]|nr:DUF6287 domain-containing protein [Streptococcus salivarius]